MDVGKEFREADRRVQALIDQLVGEALERLGYPADTLQREEAERRREEFRAGMRSLGSAIGTTAAWAVRAAEEFMDAFAALGEGYGAALADYREAQ